MLISEKFNSKPMKAVRKAPSHDDKVSWWYWFEKLDGNRAKCKNCDWLRDRGPAKSTSILRCHLKSKHSELYDQRMEAQATTPNPEQRGRKRKMTVLMTTPTNATVTGGVQQRARRRQQHQVGKIMLKGTADDWDLHDLTCHNDIGIASQDQCSPKFADLSFNTAIDHFSEKPMSKRNFMHANDACGATEALKQNMELSHAMLMFMNTLGGNDKNNNSSATLNGDGSNKRRQSSSETAELVGRFLPAANTTAETSSASSNLMKSINADNNNSDNLAPPLHGLSMFVPQQSSDASDVHLQQQSPIVKMCRTETFSAAHRLHNDNLPDYLNRGVFGKCNNGNGHGHNYTWKVVLKGPVDPHTGMVYSLVDLKREMNEVLEQVDHKHLDKDVPYFRDNAIVSTTENLSVFLYNELLAKMSSPELLHKVVVCETDKNCFSFSGYSS